MVKFETNGKLGKASITFPTNLNEITPDYLDNITHNIIVADNYSLIALCHKEKLSNFVIAGRNNKGEMSTSVVSIFVKKGFINDNILNANNADNKDIKIYPSFINQLKSGDKLIISASALSLGYHVSIVNNDLTMGKFAALINGDKDAMRNALALNTNVYFMEFKIIPNNEIVGIYKAINPVYNPFSITKEDNDGVTV